MDRRVKPGDDDLIFPYGSPSGDDQDDFVSFFFVSWCLGGSIFFF
jgi:hypothetical protein